LCDICRFGSVLIAGYGHAICDWFIPGTAIVPERKGIMSLIHLHNEVVQQRTLAAKSWSTYIRYDLDEATREIVAETIAVFHNAERPGESFRKSRGTLRMALDQAPPALIQEAGWIEGISARDTTILKKGDTTLLPQAQKVITE
jgi:hypothetical protein